MMNELKDLLKEGGAKVFTRYAVEIGDSLWSALFSHIENTYPDLQNSYCSIYRIEGIFEENGQKFAVLQSRSDMKYYRLNFSLNEESGFAPSDTLIEVTKSYTPAEEPQFSLEAVEEFENEYAKKKGEEQGKNDKENKDKSDKDTEDEKCPECGKPVEDCECEKEDKKDKYNLEEVVEYVQLKEQFEELQNQYSALEAENAALTTERDELQAQVEPLVQFKKASERKEKEAMIASFYMLSDEDKADVVEKIDEYSLDDIEAKLSIICVRNKVSFNLDENTDNNNITTFNLNGNDDDDASTPAWVKAAIAVSEKKN
jgi:hypothetical protein